MNSAYYAKSLWYYVQRYFFAEKCCVACKAPFIPLNSSDEFVLCPSCQRQMPAMPTNPCVLCGHELAELAPSNVCLQCIKTPPPWDGLYCYSVYAKQLKDLILRYKFSKEFALIPLLSAYLLQVFKQHPPCDILIPMPRHKKRLGSEGFNQIVELCRPLAKKYHLPLSLKSLTRTRYTPPQISLLATQRVRNPVKSFSACNVQGKTVLLVDDIITTGATLHHACLALKKAKAHRIYVALIARVEK